MPRVDPEKSIFFDGSNLVIMNFSVEITKTPMNNYVKTALVASHTGANFSFSEIDTCHGEVRKTKIRKPGRSITKYNNIRRTTSASEEE